MRCRTFFRLLAVFAAVAALTPATARAYTQMYRFQYCVGIASDKERLACYDNYAKELGLKPSGVDGLSATQARHGRWTVRTETLHENDETTVFVFSEGKGRIFGIDGRPVLPTLVGRCGNDVTELYIAMSSGMPTQLGPTDHSVFYYTARKEGEKAADAPGAGDQILAKIRLDDSPPQELLLRRSSEGVGYFFPNPVSFLSQMRRNSRLEFSFTPAGHADVTVLFPLEGLDEALKPLREGCNW